MPIGAAAGAAIGGAVIGGVSQNKAAKNAAKAQTKAAETVADNSLQVAQMNNALYEKIYNQNLGILAPYAALGLPAGTMINDLLGIPTSPATGALAPYGNGPAVAAGAPIGSPPSANPAPPTPAGPSLAEIYALRHNGVSGDYDAAIAKYIAGNPAAPAGYTGPSLAQIQALRNNDISGDYDAAMAAYMAAAQSPSAAPAAPAAAATSAGALSTFAAPAPEYPGFPYAAFAEGVAPATQQAAQVGAGLIPPSAAPAAGRNTYAGVPMPAARAARLEAGIYGEPVGIQPTAAQNKPVTTAPVLGSGVSGVSGRAGRPPVGVPGAAPAAPAPATPAAPAPATPAPASPLPGASTSAGALDAFAKFRAGTNYQWRLNEGLDSLQSGFAARGALDSGAATKAAIAYNQNLASEELGNYMNLLAGQQAMGLNAAGAVAGVGNTYSGNVAAQNTSAMNAQSNAALALGQQQAVPGMGAQLGGAVGGALMQWGMGQLGGGMPRPAGAVSTPPINGGYTVTQGYPIPWGGGF